MAPRRDLIPQSALAILVPEAEHLVAPFRERYDPSAAVCMPAHITLLYPFLAPEVIDSAVIGKLTACIGQFAEFSFTLSAVARFDPGVLYLAPEPVDLFRRMTLAVWNDWPQTPPYGGRYTEIIPHLTVVEVGGAPLRERIAKDFAEPASRTLPIRARATAATLLEKRDGKWRVYTAIPLKSRRA